MIRYLNSKEERNLKQNIPWEDIDPGIRDVVSLANTVKGLATVQSCVGHIKPSKDGGFQIDDAGIAFKARKEIVYKVLFEAAPACRIRDINLRYFDDGSFWVFVQVDPAHKPRLYKLFRMLK